MKKHLWFVLLPLLAFACKRDAEFDPSLTSNSLSSAQDLVVDQLVSDYRDRINTVGMTIGILRHDSVFFYGYGETKVGNGVIPDGNTFFEIGSISKVFTAIAAQRFIENQGITAQTPIKDYLPSDLPRLESGGEEVTFQNLMTHTSGLPYLPKNMGPDLLLNIDKAWRNYDTIKLYNCLRKEKLEFTPGTAWNYSNTAVGTMGTILVRNQGKTYGQIIQDEIATPLGITDIKATLSASEQSRMADGHKGGKKVDLWTDLNAMDGAGVLRGTTLDLLEFGRLNLYPPATPLGHSMEICQQFSIEAEAPTAAGVMVRMGQGWFLETTVRGERPYLYHNGGTGGFNCNLLVFTDDDAVLVVFFNSFSESNKDETDAREELIQDLSDLAIGQ